MKLLTAVALTAAVLGAAVIIVQYDLGRSGSSGKAEPKIGQVHIGDSIWQVQAALGEPDHEQVFYDGSRYPDTNLYYGEYQFVFDENLLVRRNKY